MAGELLPEGPGFLAFWRWSCQAGNEIQDWPRHVAGNLLHSGGARSFGIEVDADLPVGRGGGAGLGLTPGPAVQFFVGGVGAGRAGRFGRSKFIGELQAPGREGLDQLGFPGAPAAESVHAREVACPAKNHQPPDKRQNKRRPEAVMLRVARGGINGGLWDAWEHKLVES